MKGEWLEVAGDKCQEEGLVSQFVATSKNHALKRMEAALGQRGGGK